MLILNEVCLKIIYGKTYVVYATPLAYAGYHANGVLGVLNNEIRSKLAKNRLILLFLP